ncbi:MAG: hypothetical protein ACK4FB_14630 [Brevundimonas sp.]|uniref:hypothetical protein n=1 Tax=Brevundimonas sp. TaxID=1871086 RepID=UPI0039198DF0
MTRFLRVAADYGARRRSSSLLRLFSGSAWRLAVFAGALLLNLGLLAGLALRDFQNLQAVPDTAPSYVIFADMAPRPVSIVHNVAPATGGDEAATGRDEQEEDRGRLPGDAAATDGAPESADGADDPWRVRPTGVDDRIARRLQAGGLGCANPTLLDADERERCARRFGGDAPRIVGTGDRRRDARFARQGARELAAYEARRAAPAARTPCNQGGPIADCGVEINVEIFSSVDGFFPNLRGED